jgi:hypothetical protein
MTTLIQNYLTIAGIAHRRVNTLREMIDEDRSNFPNGDQVFYASELASCESIVLAIKAILAVQFRVLDFRQDGTALARTPATLWHSVKDDERVISEQ